MGLFSGLLFGFIVGVAFVAGWNHFMAARSKHRIFKAAALSLLGQLVKDDVTKICNNNYPPWISFPAFERVKWLNKMLDKIWPSVATAASQIIKESVEPMLALYAPPGFALGFSKLFLGNVAPQIEGIKIQTIKKGQLIMDLDFKWGGDPSIILAVRTPVGAKLPIQLKDLKFFAKVRVIFKLSDDIPCISAVVVALLAEPKPTIQYTLKLIGGSLSSVPGISDVIEGIVENAVTDTLEWPHRIVVPIGQPPVDVSDLSLKLQGRLTVKILRAESLKNMEFMSKSDPYVEAYVRLLFKRRTKTIDGKLNPEWNETFTFDVEDKETQTLVLKVFDENIGADKLLGASVYHIGKLVDEETKEIKLPLTPALVMDNVADKNDRGSITIEVTYHVFTKDEQEEAMEKERQELEERKKKAQGLVGGTMDVIGGAVGGAGKLVVGGASLVGSGVGMVGKAGVNIVGGGVNIVGGGVSKVGKLVPSLTTRRSKSSVLENGSSPGTPR